MNGKSNTRIVALVGVMLALLTVSALVIQVTLAQPGDPTPPAGTMVAQGGAVRTQLASTAQAIQTRAASTVQAGQSQVRSTVQAVQTNVQTTADVARTQVNATIDTAAMELGATVEAARTNAFATVEMMRTEVVATLQGIAQEIDDALRVIDISYNAETGLLTLTTTLDENQINTAVDAMLENAGYDEIDATIDLVDNGIVVTLENVTLENGSVVTAVLTFALVETEAGGYDLILTEVTVNDLSIPEEQLDAVLQAYIENYMEDILDGVTSNFEDDLPDGATATEYEIDRVLITDDLIAVIVIITLDT